MSTSRGAAESRTHLPARHKAEAAFEGGEAHERRPHILIIAVTLLHIAIALATIAIILRGICGIRARRSGAARRARSPQLSPI
jgi:uncharacterized membrane protein YiaA